MYGIAIFLSREFLVPVFGTNYFALKFSLKFLFWENTESYEANVFMPWLWKLLHFIDSLVIIHGRYLCRDREVMLVNE